LLITNTLSRPPAKPALLCQEQKLILDTFLFLHLNILALLAGASGQNVIEQLIFLAYIKSFTTSTATVISELCRSTDRIS
jgi:hypothetical protein